jgi:Zn2+/Cd2+-exporting ATPase
VLIKGGGPLEQLGRVTAVAFDKTGTLTTGRPEVVDVVSMPHVSREEVISAAASVQRLSDHPLARAIVRADDESGHQGLRNHKTSNHSAEVERIAGQGVVANIDGELVAVGNAKLFQGSANGSGSMPTEIAAAEKALRANGRTIAIVRRGEAFLGVIGIVDTPRPVAKQVVEELRRIGLRPLVMLSGDHQEAAQSIARELGLDDARGDLLPEDKVDEVSKLSQTYVTAMVGDGANDAPAMAAASVSIAMGAAGSDVALETADIALMGDDLAKLPFAIALAQASNRITRQNLWISLGTIAFLLPATILGFRLGAAVVLHEGSTLVVVANALRLLRFRGPNSA